MTTHNARNERIKRQYFAFLKEAKRQSEDSVDAVAKALARFESDTAISKPSTTSRPSHSSGGWRTATVWSPATS